MSKPDFRSNIFEKPVKDAKEASEILHPHLRTSVDLLDNVTILNHESVPIYPDTSELLYGVDHKGVFDYMNLRLSDYVKQAPANGAVIQDKYNRSNKSINYHDFAKDEMNKLYPYTAAEVGNILRVKPVETSSFQTGYPHTKTEKITYQRYEVEHLLEHVFRFQENRINHGMDWDLFHDLQNTLISNPEKSILFLTAHGGIKQRDGKSYWAIGEREAGSFHIPINTLLDYIHDTKGENHYAAVVLDICNPGNFKLEKFDKTPIYYSMGNSTASINEDRFAVKA